jgi:hypothetical protein
MYLSNLFSKKIKIKVNFFSKGHICPSRSLPTRGIHVPSAVKGLNKCDIYINRQCTYIVFILQCQKVQKQLPKCLRRAETSVILIVLSGVGVLYHVRVYTVTVFDHTLYMNLVPEKVYYVHD